MRVLPSDPLGTQPPIVDGGERMRLLQKISHEELVWLLGSLCSRYRIPFDAALITQQFPPPSLSLSSWSA